MNDLRKQVIDYQAERRSALEKIAQQRSEARSQLLQKINPIIGKYVVENDISIVVDKNNVLAGKTNLDITEIITEKLNKELPKISLK